MIRCAEELLRECDQLASADTADTAAAAETRRYDTLMQRYHDVAANIASLVSETSESIHKRDNLIVSCFTTNLFTDIPSL